PKSPPSFTAPTEPCSYQTYLVETGITRRSVSNEIKTAAMICFSGGTELFPPKAILANRHRHVTMGYSLGFQATRLKMRICASTPLVRRRDCSPSRVTT